MLDLKILPRQLLVLGSGYIAVELAGIFRGLGSEVTLAFRGDLPLRGFDSDIRSRLATALVNRGVRLHPRFQSSSIERAGKTTICHGADGAPLCAEIVLNAMGRIPNTHSLGLERLDVPIRNSAGAIHVDAYSRTAIQSIFAVGDVTDRLNLTPVAIAEARAFVDTEFGSKPRAIRHELAASAVFSQPQVASVGLSEESALEKKKRLKIFEADFRPLKSLVAGRNERTYMKLVTDADTEQVLGLHMLGSEAAEIVQSLAIAITAGVRKSDFDATMAVHPTAAEEFVLMRNPRPDRLPA
jgi:glutathione reductase (NADPH)